MTYRLVLFLMPWFLCGVLARAEDQSVVPVEKDQTAPFTGLLVPEARFVKLLEAEQEVPVLKGQLKVQTTLTEKVESLYSDKLVEATKPPSWYQTTEFHRWLGFFLGVTVTCLAVWGGNELVKAVK